MGEGHKFRGVAHFWGEGVGVHIFEEGLWGACHFFGGGGVGAGSHFWGGGADEGCIFLGRGGGAHFFWEVKGGAPICLSRNIYHFWLGVGGRWREGYS